MEHSYGITGIAIVALAALLCGMGMTRLKQPALVGYILAGILLGPTALGFVTNREIIEALAELGVLMLLFLIGMELSVRAFKAVWRLATAAVLLQVAASILVILAISGATGFSFELVVLLGFVISLSSTAVAIKMLEEIGETRARIGRIVVAVLIAQDLAFVPMLVVVGDLDGFGFGTVLKLVLAIALLAVLIAYLSRVRRVKLPFTRMLIGDLDLSPLLALVYCFGGAALAGVLGLSAAYGAFLAGLVVGNSAERDMVMHAAHPVQSILLMVFFLSIGLLIDLGYIWDNLGTVFTLLLVVTLFKTALNVAIFRALGEQWRRAFQEGVLISQVGEFSFLLAASGAAAGVVDRDSMRLIVSVTALSLALSPFWLITVRRAHGLATRGGATLGELLNGVFAGEAAYARQAYRRSSAMAQAVRARVGRRQPAAAESARPKEDA